MFHFIVILIYFAPYVAALGKNESDATIHWPKKFHMRGVKIDILLDVVSPFEAWIDYEKHLARFDYFGGTVTYFYDYSDMKNKTTYKIIPMTNDDLNIEKVCEYIEIQENPHYDVFLPRIEDFKRIADNKYFDESIEVWFLKTHDLDYKKSYNIFLTQWSEEKKLHIPIEYSTKTYIIEQGKLNEYIIFTFINFESNFKPSALDIKKICPNPVIPQGISVPRYEKFISYHGKEHKDSNEYQRRKKVFEKNARLVEEHNSKNSTFKMELNMFSDYLEEELSLLTGLRSSHTLRPNLDVLPFQFSDEEVKEMVKHLPETLDLRSSGIMTPVKNQGFCSSCWAFAAVAVAEGVYAMNYGGVTKRFSEQAIMDCAWKYYGLSCGGGIITTAFEYMMEYGVHTDADYGLYKEREGLCHIQNISSEFKIKEFRKVPPSADALKVALYNFGPVLAAMEAPTYLSYYSHGIFDDQFCNGIINHAVVVAGYGVEDGKPYWLIKNSWGSDFGEDGYFRIRADSDRCVIMEELYHIIL